MIEVIIRNKDTKIELGRIEIDNTSGKRDDTGNYSVRFGVERVRGVGIHQRTIWGFKRKKHNVLALVRQALMTLEEDELLLDGDIDLDAPESWHRRRGNILERGMF